MASFRSRARRVAFSDRTESPDPRPTHRSTSLPIRNTGPEPHTPKSHSFSDKYPSATEQSHTHTNRVQRLPASTDLDTLTDALERDGCLVLTSFTSRSILTQLDAETEPLLLKKRYTPVTHLTRHAPTAGNLPTNPTYRDLCSTFLTIYTTTYHNSTPQQSTSRPHQSSSTAHMLPNFSAESGFHRADAHTHSAHVNVSRYEPSRDTMLGMLVPGSSCSRSKELVRVIPGSHLWGDEQPDIKGGGIVDVELEVGDVLIVLGSLYYCLGSNTRTSVDVVDSTMLYSFWSVAGVYKAEDDE